MMERPISKLPMSWELTCCKGQLCLTYNPLMTCKTLMTYSLFSITFWLIDFPDSLTLLPFLPSFLLDFARPCIVTLQTLTLPHSLSGSSLHDASRLAFHHPLFHASCFITSLLALSFPTAILIPGVHQLFKYSFIYLFICLFTYLLIHSFIYLFIY